VGFKKDQVKFTEGERRIYTSSPGRGWAFCGDCGTPLTWEGNSNLAKRGAIIEFYISTLDDADAFIPTNHSWYSEKISWFDVSDDLPLYHGFDFNSEIDRHGPADRGGDEEG
jgi:hypothetical protein